MSLWTTLINVKRIYYSHPWYWSTALPDTSPTLWLWACSHPQLCMQSNSWWISMTQPCNQKYPTVCVFLISQVGFGFSFINFTAQTKGEHGLCLVCESHKAQGSFLPPETWYLSTLLAFTEKHDSETRSLSSYLFSVTSHTPQLAPPIRSEHRRQAVEVFKSASLQGEETTSLHYSADNALWSFRRLRGDDERCPSAEEDVNTFDI